jgi:group I intron endonuclease
MLIYLMRNQLTGSCYVGQTRRTLQQRFKSHKSVVGKANACKALSDAMLKHGTECFTIELLRQCETQAEMDYWEIKLIEDLGTFAPGGYNLTRGGGGKSGYKHTPESIEKMASTHRGKPLTEQHKLKVSQSLIGNQRALGYKHSEATRKKISDAQIGKKLAPFTAAHRAGIAAARTGSKASEATRRKMSESHLRRHEKSLADSVLIGHFVILGAA